MLTLNYPITLNRMNPQPEMLPELMLKPTEKTKRVSAMDTIRGISLLGILLMNLTGMGMYFRFGPLECVWRSLTYWEK